MTTARRVAVVGAGPAGLTAAYRLQHAGFSVSVFEKEPTPGGRTHTEHHGAGHWVDTGAGWLASFYPDTLALLDELGQTERFAPMKLRGGGDLRLDGRIVPTPNSLRRISTTRLLGPTDKLRFFGYMTRLFLQQRGELRVDLDHDGERAVDELRSMGSRARDRIVRPNFEGPFFARLEEMSAALVRAWLRCLATGTFFHVEGGMDGPWRALAATLAVHYEVTVNNVTPRDGHVEVSRGGATEQFDGAVVAVPAPVASAMVGDDYRPAWSDDVDYVPHVRLYAAHRSTRADRSGIHVFPNDLVATVELGGGALGAWGQVPAEWEWALVCAPAASSASLLDEPADQVTQRLWEAAQTIDPRLFSLDDAEIVQLIRWRHAVPAVHPGYFSRLQSFTQRPPLVFAGDWLEQPCVEGAVRSGNAAASCFIDAHNQ